jgi:hypothetical protein
MRAGDARQLSAETRPHGPVRGSWPNQVSLFDSRLGARPAEMLAASLGAVGIKDAVWLTLIDGVHGRPNGRPSKRLSVYACGCHSPPHGDEISTEMHFTPRPTPPSSEMFGQQPGFAAQTAPNRAGSPRTSDSPKLLEIAAMLHILTVVGALPSLLGRAS